MAVDRYVKTVLTIIALELFWIGVKDLAPRVEAQAQPQGVIIRGVQIPSSSNDYLPVGVVGQPVRVEVPNVVHVQSDRPIKVENADRPLKVENAGFTPSRNPGE